jgi:DNA invertase Pin-like site-specific DNA recombinase
MTMNLPADCGALAYIRVSTAEQGISGLGLEAQRAAAAAYCEREGLDLLDTVVEVASGKSTRGRPLLADTLNRLDAGEAHRLVVSKVDRLARNLLDLLGMADRGERNGWGIVPLDLGIDTSTPAGRFSLQMMGGAAELERSLIGQRTREALSAARERGTTLGRPRLISESTYVRAYALRSAGATWQQAADTLAAEGHRKANGTTSWAISNVRRLLASPYGATRPERLARSVA